MKEKTYIKILEYIIVMMILVGLYHLITATHKITIVNNSESEVVAFTLSHPSDVDYTGIPFMSRDEDLPVIKIETKTENFEVSAYNTVEWQTDDSPCISASGKNICGRDDVIACPIRFKFGTRMQIKNKIYVCEDRMKNDGGIDISFDKDIAGAKDWGRKHLAVLILK